MRNKHLIVWHQIIGYPVGSVDHDRDGGTGIRIRDTPISFEHVHV